MAAKKSKAKKAPKKAPAKPAKKPIAKVKAAPKKKTQKVVAQASAKRASAPSAPKGKAEPPPIDHATAIRPLYLGAGHGHLARAIDKSWVEALERYRKAVDEAIAYEGKRSPVARGTMVLTFAQQVQTLMNNLAARVQAILAEVHNSAVAEPQRESARAGGRMLLSELKRLNDSYGSMVGPEGIAPFGEEALPPGMAAQLEQLQRGFFNNIARWADLERALH